MNKLIPLEFKEQRIMTTKTLAEQYGTNEQNISKNFTRNSERFIEGKHYFKLEGDDLREFKGYVLNDESLKFVSVLYLWTEKGAARHAKILDTDEAWEVYEELEETYFRVRENVQALNTSKLSKELKAILMLDEKTVEMDNRLTTLEERMTIETGSQKVLCDLVNKKVVAVLGGKEAPAYQELSKKAFRKCWNDFKKILDVASYKDTPIKDFDLAKKVIIDWQPNRELELMIRGCNAQIRM